MGLSKYIWKNIFNVPHPQPRPVVNNDDDDLNDAAAAADDDDDFGCFDYLQGWH